MKCFSKLAMLAPLQLIAQAYTVCPGAPLTLSAPVVSSLTSVNYSLNPGGVTSPNGAFFVTPTVTSAYTLYTSGTNSNSAVETHSSAVNVVVAAVTISLSSPQNFTLGCGTTTTVTIQAHTLNMMPPSFALTYSFLPPGTFAQPPMGSLNASGVTTATAAGTWTLVSRFHPGNCDLRTIFSVVSNTVAPTIDTIIAPRYILDCDDPTTTLTAVCSNTNVSFAWNYPGGSVQAAAVVINTTGIPSNTIIGNYTLTLTDSQNMCKTSTVLPITQNIFPPKPVIFTSGGNALSCSAQTVFLTNQSMTGIPPGTFPTNVMLIVLAWSGPPGQPTAALTSTQQCVVPGSHTMIVKDLNNGCISGASIQINDNRVFPKIATPAPYNICGSVSQVTVVPVIQSPTASLTYTWDTPPNTNASVINQNHLVTSAVGDYTLRTKNAPGCVTKTVFSVVFCVGDNDKAIERVFFFPNPAKDWISFSGIDHAEINIYDADMRLLRTVDSVGPIDVSHLPPGVYFVRFEASKLKGGARIVIQR